MLFLNIFTGHLFPQTCVVCNRPLLLPEREICLHCENSFPLFNKELDPFPEETLWGKCIEAPIYNPYLFSKNSQLQKCIHAFKYNNQKHLASFFAKRILESIPETRKNAFTLIGFPPSSNSKKRNYNQAEVLAKIIGKELGIATCTIFRLKRHKRSQTKSNVFVRHQQLKNQIELKKNIKLKVSDHLLLVDDVLTTGATISSCISVLQKKHPIKVSVATIAFRKL